MAKKFAILAFILAAGIVIGFSLGRQNNTPHEYEEIAVLTTPQTTTRSATIPPTTAPPTTEPETEPETEPPPPPPLSPTDLQLAMFAHMAFFPFDFNAGDRPNSLQFTEMHYAPFADRIMTRNVNTRNAYGFIFAEEMYGWHLSRTHTDRRTGFSITIYASEDYRSVVLAIRGSYGDMDMAFLTQSGTWWCNFQSLAGYEHSHVASLVSFLNLPSVRTLLEYANIYITGHSLGGYLAYVATYHIAQMGLEQNIRRVTAFSAPIFSQDTINMVLTLSQGMRRRMIHYYVEGDLIAGVIGTDRGPAPEGYGAFDLLSGLFYTLYAERGIAVPETVNVLNVLLGMLGGLLPVNLPPYIVDFVWMLDGAMGEDAMAMTQQFSRIIRHQTVPQTWHTPRPEPSWVATATPLEILLNFSPELLIELMAETMLAIFDTDTHFMMNFYSFLSPS